jgi:hypothetical protein
MKTKKFNKKLALSKQTIVNLGNYEMSNLNGGGPTTTEDLTGNPCIHCFSVCPVILSICICEH